MNDPENNNEGLMETQGDRIRRLIELAKEVDRKEGKPRTELMSERRLAKHLGVSPGTGNNWRHSNDIKPARLRQIANFFHDRYGFSVKWEWLRDGDFATATPVPDADVLVQILRTMRKICTEERWEIPSEEKLLEAACLAYPTVVQSGRIDRDFCRKMVKAVAQ